jgi:membrane protein
MLSARFFRFFCYLNFKTIRQTIQGAVAQRLPGLAAEMAYNAMLALFPAILAILTAIGLFQPSQATFQKLASQISAIAPQEALTLIDNFVRQIQLDRNQGLFSVSFAAALWAASGALSAAMTAIDQIHQTPSKQLRPFWKAKLISLGLTIGAILLLIIASTLVFVSDFIIQFIAASQGEIIQKGMLRIWRALSYPLALGIVATAFAFIYRYGPSRHEKKIPILPGAVLAAIFWAMLSGAFRHYVSHFGNYNRAYGTLGAVIVLMLWLYLSSLVLLIGAQLNVTVGEAMMRSSQKKSAFVRVTGRDQEN